MPDAFIWYHSNENIEPELLLWLDHVQNRAGVQGKLFIRKDGQGDNGVITFMETYADVSRATINRIETLATTQEIFNNINRRCESFVEVT